MTKKIISFIFILFSVCAGAQTTGPQMADAMRENGKIYVVIGVISVIFIAIVALLIILERKIKKIENKMKQ